MVEAIFSDYGWLLAAMLAAGAVTGFAAGLFGIGGGIITVPVLYAAFQTLGVAEDPSLKTAVGTSLAVIIITSVRSLAAHTKTGQVDRDVLAGWAPWIAAGSAAGGAVVRIVPAEALAAVFVIGAIAIGARRLRGNGNNASPPMNLNAKRMKIPVGFGAGVFSALMGLGGGAVGVMVMTVAGRSMHQAVATAAGFGLAVAIPGALGFAIAGWGAEGLPPASLGFVNVPAFAAVALSAGIAAPIGARAAHRLNAGLLSQIFAVYVIIAAISLALDIFA